jgi:hypothetical protein
MKRLAIAVRGRWLAPASFLHFPIESLHPGPILAEQNGLLNVKNPACYLYPKENSCLPGDHFAVAQLTLAQAFANYKPYAFRFPPAQKIANLVTLATLAMLAVLSISRLTHAVYSLRR